MSMPSISIKLLLQRPPKCDRKSCSGEATFIYVSKNWMHINAISTCLYDTMMVYALEDNSEICDSSSKHFCMGLLV